MTKRSVEAMMVANPAPPITLEYARGLLRGMGMEALASDLSEVGEGVAEMPDSYGNLVYSYPVTITGQLSYLTATVRRRHSNLRHPYNNYLLVMHHRDGDVLGCTRYSN